MQERGTYLDRWFGYLFMLYAVVSPISISATNVALALIILAGLKILYDAKGKNELVFQPKLTVLYLLLFIWAGITALITTGNIVKQDISNIWEYSPIIFFPLLLQVLKINKEKVLMILLVFSSIVCILGIFQYFIPSITYPFPKQLVSDRFKGFFSHHLHTGGFYSISTILSLTLVLFWHCERRKRFVLWLFFLLNLAALLLTFARSYYVAIILVMPVLFLLKGRRSFFMGSLIVTTFLVVLFSFPNPINSRIKTIYNLDYGSNKARIHIWEASLEMFKDHPLIGVGPSNWKKLAREYYFPKIGKVWYGTYGHAHNSYLTWLSECGIIGLLLFLSFWFLVVWRLLTVKSQMLPGSFDYALIIGTLGSLGNLFIAGLFEHNFGTSVILLLISFLIGLSLESRYLKRDKGSGVASFYG